MLPEGWPVARTSDGELVVPGLRVLDYDREETTVTDREPYIDFATGTPWFHTANGGRFDGSRLKSL